MAKFAVFFSYNAETWAQMIKNPGDREAAIRKLVEPMNGKLDAMYFMFGQDDGFAIIDLPDAATAAAASIAVSSSGAFKSIETHELIAPADLVGILGRSAQALGAYTAPGR